MRRAFRTIESHTGGNPTRTVISGVPPLRGRDMMAKAQDFISRYDGIRRALMYEPRGHGVMSGALLTAPVEPSADFGVIYIEVGGLLPMCGHDTIGLVTALVETGQVGTVEPETEVVLDTPAGLVRTRATVEGGRVTSVAFRNVPAFVWGLDRIVDVPGIGQVSVDIAWGGNFYGLVEARTVDLSLTPDSAARAIRMAQAIRRAVDARMDVRHPRLPEVHGLTHVEFYGPPDGPEADVKNMVIVPPGGVDRSPCGTSTSAKAAVLHARGALPVGASFRHQSVTGAIFTCQVLEEVDEAGLPAVIVEVAGSAEVYGDSTFIVDSEDPLADGFLLP